MDTEKSAKTGSEGSSPMKVPNPESSKASIGNKFHMRIEDPSAHKDVAPSLAQETVDLPAAGNQNYVIELKEQGMLQYRLPRDRTMPIPQKVTLYPEAMLYGARSTIKDSLTRLHRLKSSLGDEDFYSRVEDISTTLATGCNLIAFMKVRAILLTAVYDRHTYDGLRRPRAASDLPIPQAFAFAIQQLGTVHVADLDHELKLAPVFPETGHKCGIPPPYSWNPNAYQQAVEYARNLGMRFAIVDPKVKNGTAWWLFRQYYQEDVFELQCPIPETNFSEVMVLAHSLFLNGNAEDPTNVIADISGIAEAGNFGIMLQNPHPGIHESSFEALSDTAADIWSNV